MATLFANVADIGPSIASALRIVAIPSFENLARSSALQRSKARAARICAPVSNVPAPACILTTSNHLIFFISLDTQAIIMFPSARSFSWSAALRQIRADRINYTPGERRAIFRQRAFAELATKHALNSDSAQALVSAGSYNRRGIMLAAIESARARREVTGEAWGTCLSAALKGTWRAAKAAMSAAKLREELQGSRLRQPTEDTRVPIKSGGGEMRSQGWEPPQRSNDVPIDLISSAVSGLSRPITPLFRS